MPAFGTARRDAPQQLLRVFGLGLLLLFLASVAAVWPQPTAAKDWTPQIKATRNAQIYWESVMRAADRDVRASKKAQKRATRRLAKSAARVERTVERRARAKRKLAATRRDLHQDRAALAASTMPPPPPPDPTAAALTLASVAEATADAVASYVRPLGPVSPAPVVGSTIGGSEQIEVADVRLLEKQLKKQQRKLRKAKKQARRASRAARVARARLAGAKASERSAKGRRESAEANLGSWILRMEQFGRTRAKKKSDLRPGLNSSFAWPARGRITQRYTRSHDGLDIAAYSGAPIRAAAFGVVSYVGWNPWDEHGRAFMIVVAHASGFETLYGHVLPRRSVRVGQEVRKGEVIGYMGNTGYSTGTHLHFELRRGRTTVNPLGYL